MDSLDIDEGFVKQDESVFSMLSPEALAALRDLAVDRGIEPQSNENENEEGQNRNAERDRRAAVEGVVHTTPI